MFHEGVAVAVAVPASPVPSFLIAARARLGRVSARSVGDISCMRTEAETAVEIQ